MSYGRIFFLIFISDGCGSKIYLVFIFMIFYTIIHLFLFQTMQNAAVEATMTVERLYSYILCMNGIKFRRKMIITDKITFY